MALLIAAADDFTAELQATSPVPEWNGERVRMALEEDMTIDATGTNTLRF